MLQPSASSTPPARALDGLLIADFSRVLAGPYLTMLLGDLGATVIKVESAEGDQTRHWGPPWRDGRSTYFQAVNRNKRSVVLDLRDAGDRALAAELARRADILIENFLPGRMEAFGLSYQTVSATNPGIVYCSLTGFGSQPGAADLPGFDLVAQAVGGLMSVTGQSDGPPTKVGVALVDVLCGLHAGLGILAALTARERLGRGQLVEVNLLTSALSALTNQSAAYLMGGVVPGRTGNAHPSVAPYETFETADGSIVVAAGTEPQFARLCRCLGIDEVATDPRFATNSQRIAHREEMRQILLAALSRITSKHAVALLREAGVPAGPVNDMAGALELAHALGLAPTWTISDVDHVRAPMSMSLTPPRPTGRPPELDEMGDDIRRWLASPPAPRRTADGAAYL
ncbi:carnitine dehydratase [Pseudonocardia sp. CNS-139]|nr:carnitine dehydratase [Pseudonocardia sp. CNS-139]